MNRPRFGVFIPALATSLDVTRAATQAADAHGIDFVSLHDHPYAPHFADTMAVIATLIGETRRVGFVTDVASVPLRPPAILAKASATLDILSGGRFTLGVGAARHADGVAALGAPALGSDDALDAFDEALTVIRAMWRHGETANISGRHYQVAAPTGPAPAHRVELWVCGREPRLFGVAARHADGWIAPLAQPFDEKPGAQSQIDAGARDAGREPSEVRRVIQLVAALGPGPGPGSAPRSGPGNQVIAAPPEAWARLLGDLYAEQRFDTFNLVLARPTADEVARFATEVVPLARERIELLLDRAERATPRS